MIIFLTPLFGYKIHVSLTVVSGESVTAVVDTFSVVDVGLPVPEPVPPVPVPPVPPVPPVQVPLPVQPVVEEAGVGDPTKTAKLINGPE